MALNMAEEFVHRVAKNKVLVLKLSELEPGDWAGVVGIGKQEGLDFTIKEIQTAVPRDFFLGEGPDKDLGWEKPEGR